MTSKNTTIRLTLSGALALCAILVISRGAYANERPTARFSGHVLQEPLASAAIAYLSSGPYLNDKEILTIQKMNLPDDTSGAYYRAGLITTERYTDIVVDLIAIGPEEWRKVVMSRVLYGHDIAQRIKNDQALNFEFVRWVSNNTFELKAKNKNTNQLFKVKILIDGSVEILF